MLNFSSSFPSKMLTSVHAYTKPFALLNEIFFDDFVASRDRHDIYFPSGCPEFLIKNYNIISNELRSEIEIKFLREMKKLGFKWSEAYMVFSCDHKKVGKEDTQAHYRSPSPPDLWSDINEPSVNKSTDISSTSTSVTSPTIRTLKERTISSSSTSPTLQIIRQKIANKLRDIIHNKEFKEADDEIRFIIKGNEDQIRSYLQEDLELGEKSIKIEMLKDGKLEVSINREEL
ncbi:hypothetical protein NF27_DT01960 [Candidatus Jidaibacter acanthamoeba]|uniref:Uncharacterized protein n=1 Tax=Candidatus Jidaibacter acanthamoebae TaxID=86105 RepID=A0A0C1MTK7_9RICK|nr:hypothetical protein [Candidatus Jidaibacter acanthamoeba]KIE05422.1 hypothetical protein NF27_DT01960 [Candidatus Jidaibacter acanthamoeba]